MSVRASLAGGGVSAFSGLSVTSRLRAVLGLRSAAMSLTSSIVTTSVTSSIGFLKVVTESLNSRIPLPAERPSSGSFLAPKSRIARLRSPLGLDEGFQLGRAFGAPGTPSAVLLDADGNVASGVAVGADDVLALLRTSQVPREPALA